MLSKFVNWFKASVVIPMLFFNYCYADVEAESQINVTDSKFIEVQAEGIGESKINALKIAWSEAVRQAVGVYLISDEKVIDDELVENIATYSKGQVESYQLLKSDKQSDGWHVVILAKIEKDVLKEEIQNSDAQKQTISFDGSNELAKKSTVEEKKKNAEDVISSINRLDIRDAIVYRSEIRKEKINGKNVNYVRHYIGLDVKKYLGKIEQLSKILEKVAISKKSFYFDNETLKQNKVVMDINTMSNRMKKEKFCEHLYNLCSYSDPYENDFTDAFLRGLSNESGFSKSEKDLEHCVVLVNSQSKLTIYCFEGNIKEKIKCLLPKSLDFVFKVENSNSDILAVSNSFSVIPARLYAQEGELVKSFNGGSYINLFTPRFLIFKTDKSSRDYNSFLYIFDQILELSDEELLNTKQLSTVYEITNDRELSRDLICEK